MKAQAPEAFLDGINLPLVSIYTCIVGGSNRGGLYPRDHRVRGLDAGKPHEYISLIIKALNKGDTILLPLPFAREW